MKRAALALVLVALAGCAGAGPRAAEMPASWRAVATESDRERLRGWRDSWLEALGRVRAAGSGAGIAAEGALFVPDADLSDPLPPAGAYRCRLFKLGANGSAMQEFTPYPPFRCEVAAAGAALTFTRPGERQRATGRLYPDSTTRAVFLGALGFADERAPPRYGREDGRDLAGWLMRVGERRWRLVLPRPRFESVLDVIELVPAD